MAPSNALPSWGNEKTMNLNSLILTNIQSSPYFKVSLFELKTFHEVIDEIYYKVTHIEPWERGSRKTAGQTGMCGGVRGVGAGGIVSSAFCLLYKLYTLKLTRKQVNNLLNHADSPYIRALGFMYIRFTQPPQDLWDWYFDYLDDEEEIDVKAGGGNVMTIGDMLRLWLVKLDWYATLFPRIPVPVQKDLTMKLRENPPQRPGGRPVEEEEEEPMERVCASDSGWGEAGRAGRSGRSSPVSRKTSPSGVGAGDLSREIQREKDHPRHDRDRDHSRSHHRSTSMERHRRSRSREKHRSKDHRRSRSHDRHQSRSHDDHRSSKSREHRRSRSRERHRPKEHSRHRSRSREPHSRHRSRSPEGHSRHKHSRNIRENSFERDLHREKKRQKHSRNGDNY